MRKVCIVGWDGATFDLIGPWIEQGKLPNLARLMAGGVHGPLRSSLPPWSFQAWSSFLTGKNPGKHGIYDFFRTPVGTYDLVFVNAEQRRGGASFWQLLSQAGRRVIAIGIPGTFPPDVVNGVMISGFDFPGEGPGSHIDARAVYPSSLYPELVRQVGPYPIDPPILREMEQGRYDVALERILDTIRQQAKTARYLMQRHPWDCFMMVFGETDGVSHYFWQFFDRRSPYFTEHPGGLEDAILRVYQEVDRQTGELFDLAPPDAVRLVVSDHGSGGISDWVLFPNRWLEQRGYLRFRGGAANRISRIRERFKQWGIAALPSRIQRFLYRNALGALGRYEARVRYGMIDWSRTQAYFDENPYFPVLRINLRGRQPQGIVEPADYESLRDRLIGELEAWRHPETLEPILEKAYRREEVYSGECLEEAADIVPKWALCEGYNLCFRLSSKAPDGAWIARINPHDPHGPYFPRKFSSHRDEAIFAAQGPPIEAQGKVSGFRIIDLAPTILHWFDVLPSDDMDGRILQELWTPTSAPLPEAIELPTGAPAESLP
jgi:predicted AlkP superfamily phosphohydrolase/phosphomutase